MKNICLAVVLFMNLSLYAGPHEEQWKKVQEAINHGLPQTAITNLEPIIQGALKDKNYAEAVKALGEKIALEGNIQGNKPEEKITRWQAEIARAPKEMVPVMDTLLAHWYWQYFQQNRWRFVRRTATAAAPGKDFTTWDLPRLFAEIDQQFQKALAAEKVLKATPVSAWDDLLQKGTMPDSYRPTLYDFIVHEALEFYSSGEQAGAAAEDAFELPTGNILPSVASPFAPADQFLAGEREDVMFTPDQKSQLEAMRHSLSGKAYFLYRQLMLFHHADPAPQLAFAAADIDRLNWAWNTAFGEDKDALYQKALERFISTYTDFDISALALLHEARLFQKQGDLVTAHKLAERGAKVFPQSPGGKLCHNLVVDIESKSVAFSTERVWNAPWPKLSVRYRNIEAIHFRAITYDWEVFLQKRHHRPENLSDEERRAILRKAPALEWSEKLTPTADYEERTVDTPVPQDLKPGFYFIVASPSSEFEDKDNVVSFGDVWVSELALVTRTRDQKIEGFVLAANSGEPLAGAEVAVWHLDNNGNRITDPTLTTDENGFFSMTPGENRGYLFRARHHGQELATVDDLWNYTWQQQATPRPFAQTLFFTDRALYRPGQIIQYKGICLWVDQSKDDYQVLKGETLTVVLRDLNGKEVARQKQQANDYGSFAGSFTAPRDRVLGQMTLNVEGRATGQTWVRVEEYKRPKFQVTLEAPKTAAKLNEKVSLTGHAMSYTGAAVDSAQVRYRVVREVRMPWWWGWWHGGWPGGETQEIAHGTLKTETDGAFKLEFVPKPDLKVSEKDEPTFVFHITADVTDTTGETRSADRDIRVGYTALEATLSADDWQTEHTPVAIKVSTRTLDDEPQVAEGNLKIYALQAPEQVVRPPLEGPVYRTGPTGQTGPTDLSNPNSWPLGAVVVERGFTTDTNGAAQLSFKLGPGAYRAIVETQDRFGKKVTGKLPLQVLQPDQPKLGIKVPHLLSAPRWTLPPGEEFMALWGTGYDTGRAFVEIEHRHQMVQRFWTKPGQTQQQIKVAVDEAMRGGFTVHVTQIRENRSYLESRRVDVPWDNKELQLKWEHFVSKLQPGKKETWTLSLQAPGAMPQTSKGQSGKAEGNLNKEIAELVATLYDESLDAFAPHAWQQRFNCFRQDYSNLQNQFANLPKPFQQVFGGWTRPYQEVAMTYRAFPTDLTVNLWGYSYFHGGIGGRYYSGVRKSELGVDTREALAATAAPAPASPLTKSFALADAPMAANGVMSLDRAKDKEDIAGEPGGAAVKSKLEQVAARKNLNETAFFFPQLTADSNGVVRMTFTMPEALTKWHFMAFAHDRSVRSGYLEHHAVTSKDLMVQPNPPRFLRERDTVEFTVKVSNQSEKPQSGMVRLNFSDALNGKSADQLLHVQAANASAKGGTPGLEQTFNIPAKESRSFAWRVTVPDGCGFLSYKTVGATETVSDGEEGAIPVLSRRVLVTESLPLPIRGPATKQFEFTRLVKSGSSKTLQTQSLTLQMVSNPGWYAVMALPYLMEFPHECSEQVFNRLYANALARSIANSDPKIHRVFEQWRNTPALESPLEKNQDLKSVALEETPWLRDAESESQARKNVGILFEDNRLQYELDRAQQKLAQMQLQDGSWPWFPGGQGNDYITLYVTTGFGRLRHLQVDVNVSPAIRSLQRLDAWMNEEYERIQKWPEPEKYVPSSTDALYLYGRSFFLKDQPIAKPHQKAIQFFLAQSRKHWLKTNCRQTQGHLALALSRFSAFESTNDPTPKDIMASLKERSVVDEEMGRFWRDTELSWWWYRAPIETQALMIEAFDEVAHDAAAVEECKVWLLKQKQSQDWKTTKATADAVYALLLRGREVLSSDALVQVKLGGKDFTPAQSQSEHRNSKVQNSPEPGTGFYEVRFTPAEIKPKLGEVTVKKVDQGVAWGSLHWQYLEDMSKVTPHEGTPLKLHKALFVKTASKRGPQLEAVKGPVNVGDELVVRIELRVDRDMEYVHLKDQRGSGTEPVNVLSQYRYQDGLAYYESTRDTASHFFIDYLPKGTYVFEYSTRVQLRGQYQTGVAEIQCMYAPEFNSHSESLSLTVK